MATALELNVVASQDSFQKRVKYFMQKGAIAVMAEAPATVGHANRVTYSTGVLNGSASIFEHAIAALTNSTLATNADPSNTTTHGITDGDLEFAVNEMWNAMSSVETGT